MGTATEKSFDRREGITLGDLSEFVSRCGREGIPPSTVLSARTRGFRGIVWRLVVRSEAD